MIECKAERHVIIKKRKVVPITDAVAVLQNLVTQNLETLSGQARSFSQPTLVSFELILDNADVLSWLHAQPDPVKCYWSDRESLFEAGGVGEADRLQSNQPVSYSELFSDLNQRLSYMSGSARYYGGFRFNDSTSSDKHWQPFGTYTFVLPRYELCRTPSETRFSCNVLIKNAGEAATLLNRAAIDAGNLQLSPSVAEENHLPAILSRTDTPDFNGWRDMIGQSLKSFANGEMEKIVLARKTTIQFDSHIQPFVFMRYLRRDISRAFHFYFQPCAECGFIGATPERLYKRTGRMIETEAVAGTRPRSAVVEEDERLGCELLNSEKDAREHDYVRQTIRQAITDLCDQIEANGEVTLLKLSRVQHLYNRFKARLQDGCSDAEILHLLHPTPAVGGVPKAVAVQKIAALEPFDRGWYTGPVGWVSRSGAEFAVAIRCGLIEGDRLQVFTGAGIVQGSDPESEWQEIEDKLGSFLSVTSKNGK